MYLTIEVLRWQFLITIGKQYEYLHGLTPFDVTIDVERLRP